MAMQKRYLVKVTSKARENNPNFAGMESVSYFGKDQLMLSNTGSAAEAMYSKMEMCTWMVDKYGYTRLCDAKRSWIYKHYKAGDIYDVTFWDHEVEIVEMQFEKIAD